jgi:hypothetical protein
VSAANRVCTVVDIFTKPITSLEQILSYLSMFFQGKGFFAPLLLYCFFCNFVFVLSVYCFVSVYLYCFCVLFVSLCRL